MLDHYARSPQSAALCLQRNMKEAEIQKVAYALETWNPLGEKANSIDGLEGYRYEAIDIIATIRIAPGSYSVEESIKQVLEQAFSIQPEEIPLSIAAREIEKILNTQ